MSRSAISVVTGVTSGLGRALFAQLAAEGAPVVAVSRPGERSRQVVDEVARHSGNDSLHLIEADLSLQADVRRAARKIEEFCCASDREMGLLILNAATLTSRPEITAESLDKMWAVNFLGAAALALGLETPIRNSSQAQVCAISSEAHRWVDASALSAFGDADADADGTLPLPALKAYGATKLAGLVFFHHLAQRWPEVQITAHHPGFVSTNLGTHGSWMLRLWWMLSRWRMRDPAEAAKELLGVVSSAPRADGELRYWEQAEPHNLPLACQDPELSNRIWRSATAATLGKKSD